MPLSIDGQTLASSGPADPTKKRSVAEYNMLITYSRLDSAARSDLRKLGLHALSKEPVVRVGPLVSWTGPPNDRFAYLCQYGQKTNVLKAITEMDFVVDIIPYRAEWVISYQLARKLHYDQQDITISPADLPGRKSELYRVLFLFHFIHVDERRSLNYSSNSFNSQVSTKPQHSGRSQELEYDLYQPRQ